MKIVSSLIIFIFILLGFKKTQIRKSRSVARRLIKCPKKKNVEAERKHHNMWSRTHGYLTTWHCSPEEYWAPTRHMGLRWAWAWSLFGFQTPRWRLISIHYNCSVHKLIFRRDTFPRSMPKTMPRRKKESRIKKKKSDIKKNLYHPG